MIGQYQEMQKNLILCIEDDYFIHILMGKVLKLNNFECVLATNGHEALKILQENDQVGIVLLDMNLPVMDGYSFLEEISQNPEYTGLRIYVTSVDEQSRFKDKAATRDINMNLIAGYFKKPYNYKELVNMLNGSEAQEADL